MLIEIAVAYALDYRSSAIDTAIRAERAESALAAALARAEKAEREMDAERIRIVDEWKAASGYGDLLAAYSESVNRARTNAERLVKALRECGKCRVCDGVGRRHPPCPYCSDSTHDHEGPPEEVCRACDGTGTDPVARAALAAHEEGT